MYLFNKRTSFFFFLFYILQEHQLVLMQEPNFIVDKPFTHKNTKVISIPIINIKIFECCVFSDIKHEKSV